MEKKVRSLKELCPKPSMAIRAAITGITRLSKSKYFKVDMTTYGKVASLNNNIICVGCLATSTIMEIAKMSPRKVASAFSSSMNRRLSRDGLSNIAQYFSLDADEIDDFEDAINELRFLSVSELLGFYEISDFEFTPLYRLQDMEEAMGNRNWKTFLPTLEMLAIELEKQGH